MYGFSTGASRTKLRSLHRKHTRNCARLPLHPTGAVVATDLENFRHELSHPFLNLNRAELDSWTGYDGDWQHAVWQISESDVDERTYPRTSWVSECCKYCI